MSALKTVLVTVLAGVLSIGIAVLGERWLGEDSDNPLGRDDQGPLSTLPTLRLPDIEGREFSSREWMGKVVVLHYWATWCPVCLEQLAQLDEQARRRAQAPLEVFGVAIDGRDEVTRFLADRPVAYPILIGNAESVTMAKRLGNRLGILPFTAIFDRAGRVAFTQAGEIAPGIVDEQIARLLTVDNRGENPPIRR